MDDGSLARLPGTRSSAIVNIISSTCAFPALTSLKVTHREIRSGCVKPSYVGMLSFLA